MKRSSPLHLSLFLSAFIFGSMNASAQQSFQLSSKFYEIDFSRTKFWDGQHRFGNVLCLTFPRSLEAESFAYALYNNNTLYFSRVGYKNLTGLYAVSSTMPAGLSVEAEIANMYANNQRNIAASPANFKQSQTTGLLGPSLTLIVRNAKESTKESLFPFTHLIVNPPDGRLASLSIHRLFVHGQDRIEVAGLRYFKTPVDPEHEAEAISDLAKLVEAAADSLQSCTAKLPPRAQ